MKTVKRKAKKPAPRSRGKEEPVAEAEGSHTLMREAWGLLLLSLSLITVIALLSSFANPGCHQYPRTISGGLVGGNPERLRRRPARAFPGGRRGHPGFQTRTRQRRTAHPTGACAVPAVRLHRRPPQHQEHRQDASATPWTTRYRAVTSATSWCKSSSCPYSGPASSAPISSPPSAPCSSSSGDSA